MTQTIEVRVPDIGDFKDIAVIEILVKPGDQVEKETPLITLESDKATMDIPSPQSGIVREIKVKAGDKISQGSLILTLEVTTPASKTVNNGDDSPPRNEDTFVTTTPENVDVHTELVVLGAGPGGYTAAFRAADLGKKVVLIERYPSLGGVCLNVGCIPSKTLLHVAKIISEAEEISKHGVAFAKPTISIDKLRSWKESIIKKLSHGLQMLAKQRNITIIQGSGKFKTAHMMQVETAKGLKKVSFDHCIIAAGSSAARIAGFPYDDARIIDSTGALKLETIPQHMLIVGGGIIGLEMATVYAALGSKISIVELMDQLIPGADFDLIQPLQKRIKKHYEAIYLKTKVANIEAKKTGLKVTFEGEKAPETQTYDCILMAVGRRPNGREIGAENAGVTVNERGFIPVDQQLRTNVPHIFAVGDIIGEPMLAHKASHEGKLVAEIIAGHNVAFDARTIPSVAYTDPEIAWMGLTENQAKAQGVEYETAIFPWAASGRAISMGREDGQTKIIFDPKTRRILGAGIVGVNAGELIAETVLALEMGADMEDIGLTIHPHPTLSETVLFAAEIATGSITDLYMPKK